MSKIPLIIFLFSNSLLLAQVDKNNELHQTLQVNDSLLFNAAFNTCDIAQLETLLSEDCEFYHDQSGFTPTKAGFINSIKNGLCKMDYKPSRVLVKESLETFPLYNNGALYGAIQTGKHQFYAKYKEDQEEKLTSVAVFTHVWILEGEAWKLSRVLSYDHQAPRE